MRHSVTLQVGLRTNLRELPIKFAFARVSSQKYMIEGYIKTALRPNTLSYAGT